MLNYFNLYTYKKIGVKFYETSAKKNTNINEVF